MHYQGPLPDLPMPGSGQRLRTRRLPLAQIVLCQGCCCGQVERGLPAVPLDWLKPIWKAEKLNKTVQLSVSGCLGPCDLPNVACLVTPGEQTWYGRLTTREDYAVLLHWARRCREQGQLLPPPAELEHLRFERWPGQDVEPFKPIEQEPGDIVLLSAADTDLLAWSAAAARLPAGFASIRALNLDRLRHRPVFDAYLDDVLQESRVIVMRLLGGLGYWREQLEAIHLLARAHQLALVCIPGDVQPDPDLVRFATVPLPLADTVWRYCSHGGVANAQAMLHFLSDTLLGTKVGFAPPAPLPETGIYHPDYSVIDVGRTGLQTRPDGSGEPSHQHALRAWQSLERPTAGLVFYRAHWTAGNLAPVDALIRALEAKEFNVLAIFAPQLAAVLDLLKQANLDVLIATTSFQAQAGDQLAELDVPILQAIFCSTSENVWAASLAGLLPRDLAMNVALPEFDGRLITTAVSFKNTLAHDPLLQTEVVRYQPRADRVEHVASLAARWARLRRLANRDKHIAIILANYPSKNSRVGNAVGLDTPASLHALLLALRDAGYDTGPHLPAHGQALFEGLIAASVHDPEFATESAIRDSVGWVSGDELEQWLGECPEPARKKIEATWRAGSLSDQNSGVPIGGLLLGNVFIGVQPARGYDQDPAAVYHSPDLPPPPAYLAFYRWVHDRFAADAVIHLGKHGNLEWLPGKGAALSADCFPEVALQDLPHIYPFIINNPGEGTQAKRRAAAVIVDHLIPPMTRAETYGPLRQLEQLLDELSQVQGLDPGKAPLVLEQIGQLVEQTHLYRDFNRDAPPAADELPQLLSRIDGYLCEIKEAQIRDGLHVLGRLPEGDQLIDLLCALVRQDNGDVPGLPRALAEDLGLDYASLLKDLAAPISSFPGSAWECLPRGSASPDSMLPTTMRTCGDAIEALNLLAREQIASFLASRKRERPEEVSASDGSSGRSRSRLAAKTLQYLEQSIWPRLQRVTDEIDHVLAALAGRFVPPGPSGAPTRGTADILPTGRNFYSLDVRGVPTPTAWRVGSAAAEALVRRHFERSGNYPESVALVVWGTSNMRTGGDDVAQVLALLGVQPMWDAGNRRVIGIEPLPLSHLGRPRIDVTVRISGLFRDAFPNLVRLLNDAVALVAGLDEPLDRNFVKAHIARDVARLVRGQGSGVRSQESTDSSILDPRSSILDLQEAERIARLRVFGSKPGAYGAGLLPAIDGRNWQSVDDLADIYLTWSSYAYTGGEQDGQEARDAFRLRLAQTDVVAQNQDNREHDIFDSDDYFQFHGGLIASVRALTGQAPAAYLGDTSRPDDVRVRTLREEACRVFRSRVVNPKWLAGVMRHGYKGAVEMAATVDYLFGYDATADLLDDWMYQRLAEAYLFDPQVQEFLRRANPWAERSMIERLLEAAERGLWQQPDPATLDRLKQQYAANDTWMETAGDTTGRVGTS